jgi:hypothetical protein
MAFLIWNNWQGPFPSSGPLRDLLVAEGLGLFWSWTSVDTETGRHAQFSKKGAAQQLL